MIATAALACLLYACSPPATEGWAEKLANCPTDAEIGQLAPWDRLEIRVYGEPEMTGEYEVSPLGTINFPRVGELQVAGVRCDEVQRIITQKLAESYLKDPSVVCINKEVKRTAITIDGAVQKPGVLEFRPGMMLTDVIAASEGLTDFADANSFVVTRKVEPAGTMSVVVPYGAIVRAEEPNVCLRPGDLVFVPQAAF